MPAYSFTIKGFSGWKPPEWEDGEPVTDADRARWLEDAYFDYTVHRPRFWVEGDQLAVIYEGDELEDLDRDARETGDTRQGHVLFCLATVLEDSGLDAGEAPRGSTLAERAAKAVRGVPLLTELAAELETGQCGLDAATAAGLRKHLTAASRGIAALNKALRALAEKPA